MIETVCPVCGRTCDDGADVDGDPPEVGNVSICLFCAGLGIVVAVDPVVLRLPNPVEIMHLCRDPLILFAQRRIRAMNR